MQHPFIGTVPHNGAFDEAQYYFDQKAARAENESRDSHDPKKDKRPIVKPEPLEKGEK